VGIERCAEVELHSFISQTPHSALNYYPIKMQHVILGYKYFLFFCANFRSKKIVCIIIMAAAKLTPPAMDRGNFLQKWLLDDNFHLYLMRQSKAGRSSLSPAGQVTHVAGSKRGTYGGKKGVHYIVLTTNRGGRLMLNPTSMCLESGPTSKVKVHDGLSDKIRGKTLNVTQIASKFF
jgi:hypothetical protein